VVGPAIRHILDLDVQELGDIRQLFVRHCLERRHAFLRAAFFEEWRQVLSMVIHQHHVRRNQARSRCSMSCLPVAKGAVLLKQRLPPCCRNFVW